MCLLEYDQAFACQIILFSEQKKIIASILSCAHDQAFVWQSMIVCKSHDCIIELWGCHHLYLLKHEQAFLFQNSLLWKPHQMHVSFVSFKIWSCFCTSVHHCMKWRSDDYILCDKRLNATTSHSGNKVWWLQYNFYDQR